MNYKKLNEVDIVESMSDSRSVLGVDENGGIKRVPKSTIGKVKSVNGNEPDENGNIEIPMGSAGGGVQTVNGKKPDKNGNVDVCKQLEGVGEPGFKQITSSDGYPQYEFLLGSWTGTDMPNLYYIMGGMALESNPEIRCFKVVLDDVTYICPTHLVQEDGTMYTRQYIGNGSMMFEDEEDNGLPFIIYYEFNGWYGKVASDGEHNCQVYGGTYTTIQVPEELVPQSVIVINKNNLSDYKATEIKNLLKSGKTVHIVEYKSDIESWITYTPSGRSYYEDGELYNAVVFTSLYSYCTANIMDFPGSIDSVTYEIKTIILHESFEDGYATFTKTLS